MPIAAGNNAVLNFTNPGLKSAITVSPGVTDTSSTSIELIGQGAPGWIVPLQQNLLALLENFASNGSPPNPTLGQIWYNTDTSKLFMCVDPTTPTWKELISNPDVYVSTSAPNPSSVGFLWFNPSTTIFSVCSVASSPGPAVWITLLTFSSIISVSAPATPRVDGQLWYDLTSKALYSWNATTTTWQRIGPNPDIDVIAGSGWNTMIPTLNKILGTPTTTLDIGDVFTEDNAWGFNQTTPFPLSYSTDVPSSEWLRFYDTVLGLGTLLGVSTAGLVRQDFHLPGQFNNEYGIPFMLDQWDQLQAKIGELQLAHLNIASSSLEFSNAIISFTGTTNAGSILGVTPSAGLTTGFTAAETWTINCTNASLPATFSVTGSVSGSQAPATVGTLYDNGIIVFTINVGVNAFIVGDLFHINVLPNLKTSYSTTWGAGNSGINATYTFSFASSAHQRAFFNAGGILKLSPSFDDTTTGHNQFWNTFLTAIDHVSLDYKQTTWGVSPATDPHNAGYYDLNVALYTNLDTTFQTIFYVDAGILPSSSIRSNGYQIPFTVTAAVAGAGNIGNGTVGSMSNPDQNPLTTVTETWTLTCTNATVAATFAVIGSKSGAQTAAISDIAYTNAHVDFTIAAGGTPWAVGDTFTFQTTGVLNYFKVEARIDDAVPNNLLVKVTLNDTSTVTTDTVTTTGSNKGFITYVDMVKANAVFLNNPEIAWPAINSVVTYSP